FEPRWAHHGEKICVYGVGADTAGVMEKANHKTVGFSPKWKRRDLEDHAFSLLLSLIPRE
ncbi:MAG: hypothetical protein KAV83_06405, partial [Desulfobacterales bacterium]|nr:hypothetical protein [Desulfobacterales bacterium]